MKRLFYISFFSFLTYVGYATNSYYTNQNEHNVVEIVKSNSVAKKKELFDSMQKVHQLQKTKKSLPSLAAQALQKDSADKYYSQSSVYLALKKNYGTSYSEFYFKTMAYTQDNELKKLGAIIESDIRQQYGIDLQKSPRLLLDSVTEIIHVNDNNPRVQFELFQVLAGQKNYEEDVIEQLSGHISQFSLPPQADEAELFKTHSLYLDKKLDLLFRMTVGRKDREEKSLDLILSQNDTKVQRAIAKKFFWNMDEEKKSRLIEQLGEERAGILFSQRLPASEESMSESRDEFAEPQDTEEYYQ